MNYFKSFPSFLVADFELVKICWENYLTFCLFDICFNVHTGESRTWQKAMQGIPLFFLFHALMRCSLCKPSISQISHSRNTGKFVKMRPLIFGDTNATQKIALNPFTVGTPPPPHPPLLKGRVRPSKNWVTWGYKIFC